MLKTLKEVLEKAGSRSPAELILDIDRVSNEDSIDPKDRDTLALVKYFAELTQHQHLFIESVLRSFQAMSSRMIDFEEGIVGKMTSLDKKVDLAKSVIKNQENIVKMLDSVQKSVESSQKFNKEAIFELAREISSVNIVNSKSSPVPIEIEKDLAISYAVKSKVVSYARVNDRKMPSVVELEYSDGSKKLLTINRDSNGDYSGHSLKELNG